MKLNLIVLFCFIFVSLSFGDGLASKDLDSNKHKSNKIDTKTSVKSQADIVVFIKGMVCSFCAQGISKSLDNEPAVKSVDFKLENGTIELNIKRFRKLSDKKIVKIIHDAGYEVHKIQR